MRRRMIWLVLALVVAYGGYVVYSEYAAALYHLAGQYDRMMNPYGVDPEAPEPTEEDRALHRSMFIADMHADTLKWERDLLERSAFGHTDVPRMMEGNIALQGFTIVTKSPMRMPWSRCVSGRSPDTNTLLSLMQGRPAFDLRERAFYQIERFKDAVERSKEGPGPELRHIETADDLRRLVEDRKAGKAVIGGILGVEGGHWVGEAGGEDAVKADMQELFDAGLRMFAPNHRFDNDLSGASEGCDGYGLTERGLTALKEAERLGIAVDVAHISPAGLRDVAMELEQPFTNSHTGIRAECDEPCREHRNLSDLDIEVILEQGGVISVGFWPQAIGPSVWRVAEVMEHIKEIAERKGLDPSRHIALGSDYDGSVTPLIEAGHLEVLTAILRQRDEPFDDEAIRDISGRNSCRLFATVLPGGNPELAEELCAELADLPMVDWTPPEEPDADEEAEGLARAGGAPGGGAPSGGEDRGLLHAGASENLLTHLVGWVVRTQSEMNHWLRGHLAAASGNGGWAASAAIVAVGFLYGILHAAGPGHGKVVVGSYFLAHPGRPRRAVALSAGIAFLQAATAIALVTGLLILAGTTMSQFLDQAAFVEAVAYGLILLLGVGMLLRLLVRGSACGACAHDGAHEGGTASAEPGSRRDYAAMALAVGLRPCSGALILLLFTLTAGVFAVGVLATLAMALGTAITISLAALGAIGLRRGAGGLALRMGGAGVVQQCGPALAVSVQGLAALVIAAAGALFLLGAVLRMGVL